MKKIIKLMKKIILSFLIIYSFNMLLMPLNINLPFNYITLGVISIFGFSGLISFLLIMFLIF